jgi:pimeloyl-ACP methyl ester carboxylesterase
MRLRQRLVVTAISLVIALVLPIVPAHGNTDPPTGQISWKPCKENRTALCGTLTLPVDWTNPTSDTFELALVKRPATDPERRVGSLFVNPGGPGGSGVDFALAAEVALNPELVQRFDIIGIDPRGVARSHPVVCSLSALEQPGDTPRPRSSAEFDALVAFNRQLAQDCRAHTGPLYDHVDSVSVARDIDAVRAALGEATISWYGASYGSLMGQMYAEHFPGRIRAMVNDGNMDHSLNTAAAFQLTEASFVEDSYTEFVAWCNRSTQCALHGQDVPAIYSKLLTEADAGTLVDPVDGHTLDSWELLDITQFFFNRPRWTQLADLIASLTGGVPTNGTTAARALFKAERAPRTRHISGQTVLVEDVRPQFCQDWSLPFNGFTDLDRLWQASNRVAPQMRTSVNAWVSNMQCVGWPGRVNNPQHRLGVAGAPVILMLNGIHDPATGYAWAQNVARQLGDQAVLLTYLGAGHTAYRRNACTLGTTNAYLSDLIVPPSDITCAASDPALAATSTAAQWLGAATKLNSHRTLRR